MTPPASRRDHVDAGQIEMLAACGVPEADIAKVLGTDVASLRQRFGDALDAGRGVANATVAESLLRKAIGDGPQSVTAAIFWLKARAGWSEASVRPGDRVTARIEAMDDAELDAAIAEFQHRYEMAVRNGS